MFMSTRSCRVYVWFKLWISSLNEAESIKHSKAERKNICRIDILPLKSMERRSRLWAFPPVTVRSNLWISNMVHIDVSVFLRDV